MKFLCVLIFGIRIEFGAGPQAASVADLLCNSPRAAGQSWKTMNRIPELRYILKLVTIINERSLRFHLRSAELRIWLLHE